MNDQENQPITTEDFFQYLENESHFTNEFGKPFQLHVEPNSDANGNDRIRIEKPGRRKPEYLGRVTVTRVTQRYNSLPLDRKLKAREYSGMARNVGSLVAVLRKMKSIGLI